ncbi:MAG: bifunctional phosphoribosyl-AMP cyclohydrolase/phosphoribosyl-ATP diphosphatase HisIE [Lachnospiraceae bacterium]|nr:bifunctional phosphoribosyl-AMP cyclohydrolase/phosphoribosyl-ATP diphosphatase HisIE [Lachnospiraceae bacterium]
MQKKLISVIYLKDGKAVCGFQNHQRFDDGDALRLAEHYSNRGMDALLIFDLSDDDDEHEQSLNLIKEMSRKVDIPMYGCGNIKRVEDVKKLIYAGCRKAVLNYAKPSNLEMLEEVSKRFGKEKISICIDARCDEALTLEQKEQFETYADDAVIITDTLLFLKNKEELAMLGNMPVNLYVADSSSLTEEEMKDLLNNENVTGLAANHLISLNTDIMELKFGLKGRGISVNTYESSLQWGDFKVNSDGLVPVVVQDYKTQDVLMVAYMNQEAYETTVRSGRMTYWSRSRQELWIKGLTSGHFQYVRELCIDCDNDTILAKVAQIGAACHTGNRSCFYRTMMKKDYVERNPMKVFEDVYGVIEDRRLHPKEGSYTNYLFDKGIDKILKKVGEEAAEIIIAAKNPNPEEIKYEISDFLYHVMVLMSERGVTWEDIAKELADR